MEDIEDKPPWAEWFERIGYLAARNQHASVGEEVMRIVLSVPTGQYVAWLIASGALSIPEDQLPFDQIESDERVTIWHERMCDVDIVPGEKPGVFKVAGSTRSVTQGFPCRRLPVGTPPERKSAKPKKAICDRARELPGRERNWHLWWSRNCLAPVVVIGDGREYLQHQREELLRLASHWFERESSVLLSEESGQTSNPERMYLHPYMVLTPGVGHDKPWLRAMEPRLVIVTSWGAWERRDPRMFAGAPHIVLANRRVPRSLDAADFLDYQTASADVFVPPPPPGIVARLFTERVAVDNGDVSDDEDDEI